jgi:cytosine/uracil/thiamine/allantoin permease
MVATKGPSIHVPFCVRIGVQFGIRFAAKGVPQVNLRLVFAEMWRQTIVMDVR